MLLYYVILGKDEYGPYELQDAVKVAHTALVSGEYTTASIRKADNGRN